MATVIQPIANDLRSNASHIRTREALASLEHSLIRGRETIIAGRYWAQIEALEVLASRFAEDLTFADYRPTEVF